LKRAILVSLCVAVLLFIGFVSYSYTINRPVPQNEYDVPILERTLVLLQSENRWSKQGGLRCEPNGTSLSLYCALRQASLDVTGKFQFRTAALQEVRSVIDELYPDNSYMRRLVDFNNAPETSFEAMHDVLGQAIVNLKSKGTNESYE
jgi:hypothetical protein